MASVTSTYARAFADVVFDKHLDPAQTLAGGAVCWRSWRPAVWNCAKFGKHPRFRRNRNGHCWMRLSRAQAISRTVRNFVAVLMDHRRIKFLDPIVKEFEQELNRRMGFIEAQITTARELGEPERNALESQVAKLTGQKVRARYSQDGSILGGAIVKIGSTIYDGSVKGSWSGSGKRSVPELLALSL